jgi:phenylacetic acid degradation operon negative regulatory protein
LEKRRILERDNTPLNDRLYRLTAAGRLHVLGGRDPVERWERAWDGQWRMVLFDVPTGQNAQRERLRRYLHAKGFGYLQNSVWITPDPLKQERQILGGGRINVESLVLLEARPCAGESDGEIVVGAWDFERINRGYARYLKVLEERPIAALRSERTAKALLHWATRERETWLDAVTNDPLLPARLLPADYVGERAWRRRVEVLRDASRQLRTFHGANS